MSASTNLKIDEIELEELERDRELLARAQASADGFGELFDRYYDRIYSYAYRRTGVTSASEDIAACTFEDAMRGISRFKWRSKPIVAWLYRIAARRLADYYRQSRKESDLTDLPESEGPMETGIERSEEATQVRAGLMRLMPRDREIIQLTFFDELNAAEVSGLLGCTVNSVYVRTHRALTRLQIILLAEEVRNG